MEHIQVAAVPIYFLLVYAGVGFGLFSLGATDQSKRG